MHVFEMIDFAGMLGGIGKLEACVRAPMRTNSSVIA
jgi:hypothetical protein